MQNALATGRLRRAAIGAPHDPAEGEADRAAAAVLGGRLACHCGGRKDAPCPVCRGGHGLTARRRPAEGAATPSVSAPRLAGGKPLGRAERSLFERGFGTDLSHVRLHTGPEAEAAAAGLHARAFALGDDIAFARGTYAPGTAEGKRLLAHELAHVALGHTGIRREGEDGGTPAQPPAAGGGSFDPCTVNVDALDNAQLLANWVFAKTYLDTMIASGARGEGRYYDYANLYRRLLAARTRRAAAGHAWLNADISSVPPLLYRLEPNAVGNLVLIYRVAGSTVSGNLPAGQSIYISPDQLNRRLADDHIPSVDLESFFGQQDPNAPQRPWPMQVPERPPPRRTTIFDPRDPFGLNALPLEDPFHVPTPEEQLGFPSYARGPLAFQAAPMAGPYLSPQMRALSQPFNRPIVTGGPFNFDAAQVGGFRTDWRGDLGESLYAARDPQTLAQIQDLNLAIQNFTLYDFYDPRTGTFESVKTQLPTTPGAAPDLSTYQTAVREVFGNADAAKRTQALQQLQNTVDPTLTLDRMLLQTRFAVNPETVGAAQDSVETAIRRGQMDYEALLSAMLRNQPISVQHSRGPQKGNSVTYNDFATLHADFTAKHITQARYRDAVGQLAQRARSQVVSTGAGAETSLRPLIDLRQRYDFSGAAEFAGLADTAANRRLARARQQSAFESIGVPELLDVQVHGLRPVLGRSAKVGAGAGFGTSVLLGAPHLIGGWDTDPYAGRRYLTNVGLNTTAGAGQAVTEEYMRLRIAQYGLDMAAARAAAGRSITPVTIGAPASRLAGGTVLGGAFSGGVTLASMWIDEAAFGADYTTIDYAAKGTRAAVIGSGASLAGALAAGGTTAYLAGGGGAAGCTVVLPGVGTVACGTVGAAAGFIVGVGSYVIFDWLLGDVVESTVRTSMGEQGCTGR